LVSFHPVVLKKIFKDFQFFNQSEAMAAILDVGQGHQTQKEYHISVWSNLTQLFLRRRSKCEK
jgi:hypothetical protein